ncbi:hypothetical protein [Halonotius pteroides]|uniref:DUF8128 domain-containing protein n=1 Tax=Halonotius pteroides TaxID=268735 RepID=A0A3A6QEZ2_9EURY|nr:hypothetical protein [Halonotius pteroides]RJX51905.1 hypothetical protein DP106_00925 [Halonotius pteroides]
MIDRLHHYTTKPTEEQAEILQKPPVKSYSLEVKTPRNGDIPAVPVNLVKAVTELQSKRLGFVNTSPVASFEIRRSHPDKIKFQFSIPTVRLERKLRTHLTNEIPGIRFEKGSQGIPVTSEDTVGGGLLTTGRRDWYPLKHEFKDPPINSVVSALHRHAMRDTKFIVQILFQPVIGRPLRRWYWRRRAYQRIGYLRKEKEKLWGSRNPTPREKRQADAIEDKAGTNRFHTSIRFLVIGADEYTQSRVKELSGGYNIFENPDTGQYLDTVTVKSLRENQILGFAETVANREFGSWSHRFQTSVPELAALLSLPSTEQENITQAEP